MPIRTILHPTDYSELSQAAFRYAVELAQVHGARVIVVHVVETLGPENVTFGEAVSQRQPDSYRQRLWEELHKAIPPERAAELEYILGEGDPVTAILEAAGEHHCDLIVLGSHGRRGLQRLLHGSVAEEVIRRSICPVLVVKMPAAAESVAHEAETALHPHLLSEGSS
jgi:nucleotide-binding universal stress UspA family protein